MGGGIGSVGGPVGLAVGGFVGGAFASGFTYGACDSSSGRAADGLRAAGEAEVLGGLTGFGAGLLGVFSWREVNVSD